MKFLKNNFLYVLWFAFYFLIAWLFFGGDWNAFYQVTIIYSVSIGIALSPFGEVLFRFINGARKPATNKEKEYLEGIFKEVYKNAKGKSENLSSNIKIYISNSMYPNAFACGRNTIAVTKGAIEFFTEDELKGIMAHEIGHLKHGHTKAGIITVVGNMLFSAIIAIVQLILQVVDTISTTCADTSRNIVVILLAGLFKIFILVLNFYIIVINIIGRLLLSANSRKNEFQADKFALDIGYGEELLSSLCLLEKYNGENKLTMFQQMTMSHPHIEKRIARLEEAL